MQTQHAAVAVRETRIPCPPGRSCALACPGLFPRIAPRPDQPGAQLVVVAYSSRIPWLSPPCQAPSIHSSRRLFRHCRPGMGGVKRPNRGILQPFRLTDTENPSRRKLLFSFSSSPPGRFRHGPRHQTAGAQGAPAGIRAQLPSETSSIAGPTRALKKVGKPLSLHTRSASHKPRWPRGGFCRGPMSTSATRGGRRHGRRQIRATARQSASPACGFPMASGKQMRPPLARLRQLLTPPRDHMGGLHDNFIYPLCAKRSRASSDASTAAPRRPILFSPCRWCTPETSYLEITPEPRPPPRRCLLQRFGLWVVPKLTAGSPRSYAPTLLCG